MVSAHDDKYSPFTRYVEADRYMKVGTPSECDLTLLQREVEALVMCHHGGSDSGGGRVKEYVKKYMRSHHHAVGHPIRRFLWASLCRAIQPRDTITACNFYQSALKDHFPDELDGKGLPEPTAHLLRLPSFVDRDNIYCYQLTDTGCESVSRLMCIMHHYSPDITHCPLLYPISSLLIHYMREDEVYAFLTILLTSQHAREVYRLPQTKQSTDILKITVMCLTKKYAKATYAFLSKLCEKLMQPMSELFEDWLWWMFRDLPFVYLVRIMDCYLVEGVKVFFRVALALLILFREKNRNIVDQLHRVTKNITASALMKNFCSEISVSVEKILEIGFGIRRLKSKGIRSLMKKCEVSMRSGRHPFMSSAVTRRPSLDRLTDSSRQIDGLEMEQFDISSTSVLGQNLQVIWQWLPVRISLLNPILLFTTEEHGTSLVTFFSKIDNNETTLLIIKTTDNEIFGAYCSSDWANRFRHVEESVYFGTGETFLFSIYPTPWKYPWVGAANGGGGGGGGKMSRRSSTTQMMGRVSSSACMSSMGADGSGGGNTTHTPTHSMFMAVKNNLLHIGGGHGIGLQLGESVDRGRSERCDTFDNPPLSSTGDFKCQVVEVFGFEL